MRQKHLILAARLISVIFTPFYLPIVGLIVLFLFSYMSMLPWSYKLFVLLLVWLFTILLPVLLIRMYRRSQGWNLFELGYRERRMVPYIISILCYFCCFYVMNLFHVSRFISCIPVAALVIQMTCAIINVWHKISTHTAAIGGMAGALIGFSVIFAFNPVWWFCILLLIAGLVGTSRMILRQHSLSQVVAGFLVGFVCAYFIVCHS